MPLAVPWLGFSEILVRRRGGVPEILPPAAAGALFPEAAAAMERIATPRSPILGGPTDRPLVMGIVNVTPDSFSDGGRHQGAEGVAHGLALVEAGADILDIGGESTRPGAEPVPEAQEIARVLPVIEGLRQTGCPAPLSIDTRKAGVARAAIAAGAQMVNDVSALTHDPDSAAAACEARAVCLMHAQGEPQTMQKDPRYGDVLLDVYDFLAERVAAAEAAGIAREALVIDPGIGFGKRLEHNLALMRGLSLFHALGCPVLFGASRKKFIGTLSGVAEAGARVAGSVAAALAGAAQGAAILRVHDVAETAQALAVWHAVADPSHRRGETP
ncbi:MAG: dihydropteroate synthase [Pseudomonadota bacterium]